MKLVDAMWPKWAINKTAAKELIREFYDAGGTGKIKFNDETKFFYRKIKPDTYAAYTFDHIYLRSLTKWFLTGCPKRETVDEKQGSNKQSRTTKSNRRKVRR
jgi:hypothetical protein